MCEQLVGRIISVDHVLEYRRPKKKKKKNDSDSEEEEEFSDEDYDERRKRVWDYELYNTQGASHSSSPYHADMHEQRRRTRQQGPHRLVEGVGSSSPTRPRLAKCPWQ